MNRSIIATALLLTLSACGGSGGSSKTTTPSPTVPNTITVKAVYTDECGNETSATDAKLIIHNNDFSNKEIVSADANGIMTYSSSNASETVSIVTRGGIDVDGVMPINLTSYIDHPVVDMGTIETRTYDTSQCSCQQSDLIVSTPSRPLDIGNLNTSIYYYNTINNSVGSSQALGLRQCFQVDESVKLMSAQMKYSAPDELYGVLIPDFTQVSSVDAVIQGQPVNINTDSSSRRVAAFIDGAYHLINSTRSIDENVYSYQFENTGFYVVDAYDFNFLDDIPNVNEAYTYTLSRQRSTNINQTFDLPKYTIDYNELFEILTSESGSYSLSNTTDFDFINLAMLGRGYGGNMLDWYIYAPTSGRVPNLDNLDLSVFISNEDLTPRIDTLTMEIFATGYKGINNYTDYLNSIIDIEPEDFIQSKWQQYNYALFSMTMEAEGLSSAVPTKAQFEMAIKSQLNRHQDNKNVSVKLLDSEQKLLQ